MSESKGLEPLRPRLEFVARFQVELAAPLFDLGDPSLHHFRVTMHFETSARKHAWLNRSIGIGSALRLGKAVVHDAYVVR